MSRAKRLLELIQLLRRHRYPVSGADIAKELGISLRTVYRDIATLQSQGAAIEGEAGVGYLLRSGFTIPPLMFTSEEIEAIVLGSRWVAQRADGPLAAAAENALAKISAVVPRELHDQIEHAPLLAGPSKKGSDAGIEIVRNAIRSEEKLQIRYRDGEERESLRTVWPFALAFFDDARVVIAWCEMRQGYRHFRMDRIAELSSTGERYPRRRQILLREWRRIEGVPES